MRRAHDRPRAQCVLEPRSVTPRRQFGPSAGALQRLGLVVPSFVRAIELPLTKGGHTVARGLLAAVRTLPAARHGPSARMAHDTAEARISVRTGQPVLDCGSEHLA